MDTAVFFYCFGNASPIDVEYNPIPSIASIRRLNKDVPITVMTCENNENFYLPYMRQLDFKLYKFTAKHGTHQLCYKPSDAFGLLEKSVHQKAIVCDTDIMWTRDVNDLIKLWDKSGKDYFIQQSGNAGVFGISRNGDPTIRQSWADLSEILAQCDTKSVTDLLRRYYSIPVVNDEVSLSMLRSINPYTANSIEYYDNDLFCRPDFNKYTQESFGMHYDSIFIEKFFREQYHFTTKMRVGRVGLLLSIREYYDMLQELLGRYFDTFTRYIPLLNQKYRLNKFLEDINVI